jgi:hypothetical protein
MRGIKMALPAHFPETVQSMTEMMTGGVSVRYFSDDAVTMNTPIR